MSATICPVAGCVREHGHKPPCMDTNAKVIALTKLTDPWREKPCAQHEADLAAALDRVRELEAEVKEAHRILALSHAKLREKIAEVDALLREKHERNSLGFL